MTMSEYRKSVTDRRSRSDRRNLLLPNHPIAERRCGVERRTASDRRMSTDIFKSTKKPKRSLLCAILKNGINFGRTKKGASKSAPATNRADPQKPKRKRAYLRLPCKIPVKILNCETHRFMLATARNYSNSGMYLESEYAPTIDSGIAIKLERQSQESAKPQDIPKYHSRVIWRKDISKNVNVSRYGIGVKHCIELEEFLKLFSL